MSSFNKSSISCLCSLPSLQPGPHFAPKSFPGPGLEKSCSSSPPALLTSKAPSPSSPSPLDPFSRSTLLSGTQTWWRCSLGGRGGQWSWTPSPPSPSPRCCCLPLLSIFCWRPLWFQLFLLQIMEKAAEVFAAIEKFEKRDYTNLPR